MDTMQMVEEMRTMMTMAAFISSMAPLWFWLRWMRSGGGRSPSFVMVTNVKSASATPATLCASIFSWYSVEGFRLVIVKRRCGFNALETEI